MAIKYFTLIQQKKRCHILSQVHLLETAKFNGFRVD